MTLRLCTSLLVLAASAGACSPSFEVDLSEVEITQRGFKVAAAPGMPAADDASTSSTFTLSSSNTAWAKHVNADVLVHHVRIAPSSGVPNLDFVKFTRATMAAWGRPDTTTEVMNFARPANAPSVSAIDVDTPVPADITIPWSADNTVVEIQLAGQLPAQDWAIDVMLRLSGKITYRY